jgi:AcrR family transcriptional regulator
VSPNAAYRHFAALPELIDAIGERARAELADSMRAEIKRRNRANNPVADAASQMKAVGRGYIGFALRDPGLFALAFPGDKSPLSELPSSPDSPWLLLTGALDALVAAGELAAAERDLAATSAWAAVHGMSHLLLGPLANFPNHNQLIEACLNTTIRGVSHSHTP